LASGKKIEVLVALVHKVSIMEADNWRNEAGGCIHGLANSLAGSGSGNSLIDQHLPRYFFSASFDDEQ